MRFLTSFKGRRGDIVIMEDRSTGARSYCEVGVFQSHATEDGIGLFAYVHLIVRLFWRANDVLSFGCAARWLATMLHRQGKRVTIVDDNPQSFNIARKFFGLPMEVACVTQDFRDFVSEEHARFDGIGIDIGAPDMRFDELFAPSTCRAIRSRLARGGRIAMNMRMAHDFDTQPDRTLSLSAAHDLRGWLYDEPGEPERNIVLSAVPEKSRPCLPTPPDTGDVNVEQVEWNTRRPRLFPNAAQYASGDYARPEQ